MFSNFFVFENRAFFEIMWKKYCRAGQATDDNMAHAHCMLDTESTNTYSEHVTLIAFPLHERLTTLRYMYIVLFFLSLT